jgi:hypothetical protein
MFWLLRNKSGRRLLTGCILSLTLVTAPVALAIYKPPAQPSAPKNPTTTTGRRGGCLGNAKTTLTALAPRTHVGQTISTHPVFAWFVPDLQPLPMKFRLYKYGSNGDRQLVKQIELQSSPGIVKVALPKNEPGLAVGQTYNWQVVLLCNPNHPSSALVTGAQIKVVEMPPALRPALTTTRDAIARAELYAQAGFWYNALGEALASEKSRAKALQLTLLEDLANLEKATKWSSQLRQVIEAERQPSSSTTR